MAKRQRDEERGEDGRAAKKRKAFSVGPAHLPDGTRKRKADKIKKNLIHKAKLKKSYAKIKKEELQRHPQATATDDQDADERNENLSNEPHPDRQALIDASSPEPAEEHSRPSDQHRGRRRKQETFGKEAAEGQRRKEEAAARLAAREEAERQRKQRIAERERWRKAMVKARTGGNNGQRKLGRESKVLLEKVKRMVSET